MQGRYLIGWGGVLFHNLGAARENVQSPLSLYLECGMFQEPQVRQPVGPGGGVGWSQV